MMKVIIEAQEGIIWMRNAQTGEGITSTGYVKDGTQQKIIAALEEALFQAKGQFGLVDNVN
ncbi:Rrf2 family transcriptional regulator [Serratia marcescens]|uniref:Rrf2 family transcriptional regulator n=3 Tax=Serratia TaxID=613 RepID=A0ABD5BS92_SERMA|nr:Rrf2 family transcriptional regulator [Serratia marcescens]MDQ9395701.1 Rrf2 family transcriptional regulator [Serratia marcescens]MDQ9407013.1 Rrf2 family transcriptional regulator [Serratia marcescens]MDQ9499898.1 Rrf2 family transcriptional regulator [Serratia marcescens]MDQ9506478.1 Rrf2 family transcriptional regulator [Serratia marcescens]MDQ9529443.1 Rrf2 family transcriptional regulator [Serratia marcescens]